MSAALSFRSDFPRGEGERATNKNPSLRWAGVDGRPLRLPSTHHGVTSHPDNADLFSWFPLIAEAMQISGVNLCRLRAIDC